MDVPLYIGIIEAVVVRHGLIRFSSLPVSHNRGLSPIVLLRNSHTGPDWSDDEHLRSYCPKDITSEMVPPTAIANRLKPPSFLAA